MLFISKKWLTLYGLIGGAGYVFQNYTVDGLEHLSLKPVPVSSAPASPNGLVAPLPDSPPLSLGEKLAVAVPATTTPALPPVASRSNTARPTTPLIHIASFNTNRLTTTKLAQTLILETLLRICEPFDIIALQEIDSIHQDTLPRLVDQLNQRGKNFDFIGGPRVGRLENKEQFAFLFNTATVETDRNQLYTVDDAQDLLEFEPLVAWFRSKAVPVEQAFTFTLINFHLGSDRFQEEIAVLPELVRSVQRDGRGEDDIILVGDFHASDVQLQFLTKRGMTLGLTGKSTSTRGAWMLDNFVFPARATDEFTGKSGVIDFLREQNLSLEGALQVSDHLPIWAEFFAVEGGIVGKSALSTPASLGLSRGR